LLVVVFGGYAVAGVLSAPSSEPMVVGGALQVRPLSGWEVGSAGSVGEQGPPFVRFSRGTGNLDVVAPVAPEDPVSLVRTYVRDVLEPEAEQLEVSEEITRVTLPWGEGARVTYAGLFGNQGSRIEGEITGVVAPEGFGTVFDAWGPEGLFGYVLSDTEAMITTSEPVT